MADPIVEVAIGVGSAIVGALVGYGLNLKIERRNQQKERLEAAYRACLGLRETLANWMNEISDATREGQSTQDVLKNLLAVFEHEKYQRQIGDRFFDLKGEPCCEGLARTTDVFHRQAFETKGRIAMALIRGDFARDYPGHRRDALQALRGVYDGFNNRLEEAIRCIENKRGGVRLAR
jgi:hypothetical protein